MSPLDAVRRGQVFNSTTRSTAATITPRLLSIAETAVYFGALSTRQVHYFIARGLLHPVRLDRRVRIDRQEVDRLIERAMQRDLRPPPLLRRPGRSVSREIPACSPGVTGSPGPVAPAPQP
jgi:helix-turn-helix protein